MFDRVLNTPLKVLQNTSIEVAASKHLIRFPKSNFPDAVAEWKKRIILFITKIYFLLTFLEQQSRGCKKSPNVHV